MINICIIKLDSLFILKNIKKINTFYKNTLKSNKSSINLQMLIVRFMIYHYKTTEHKKNKRSMTSSSQTHTFI